MADTGTPAHEPTPGATDSADDQVSRPSTPQSRRLLSRRAVLGGGGVLLGAVVGGLGTAVGGGVYETLTRGISGGAPERTGVSDDGGAPLAVAVTDIGVSSTCDGYQMLIDRAPAQAAAEIS